MARFLVLVLGQAIADFLIQPRWIAGNKRSYRSLLLHGVVIAASVFVLGWIVQVQLDMVVILLFAAAHLLIDMGKGLVEQAKLIPPAWSFPLDQALHIAFGWWLISVAYPQTAVTTGTFSGFPLPIVSPTEFLLAVGSFFVLSVFGGSYWVPKLLDWAMGRPEDSASPGGDSEDRSGFWIGILERIFLFLIVIFQQPVALGVLVALKSLARHKEYTENPRFAERFLLGTLFSFLIAVVPAGIIVMLHRLMPVQ